VPLLRGGRKEEVTTDCQETLKITITKGGRKEKLLKMRIS
jgi:hypothetical protein